MWWFEKCLSINHYKSLWKGPVKWIGNFVFIGAILGSFLHYLRFGPRTYSDEPSSE